MTRVGLGFDTSAWNVAFQLQALQGGVGPFGPGASPVAFSPADAFMLGGGSAWAAPQPGAGASGSPELAAFVQLAQQQLLQSELRGAPSFGNVAPRVETGSLGMGAFPGLSSDAQSTLTTMLLLAFFLEALQALGALGKGRDLGQLSSGGSGPGNGASGGASGGGSSGGTSGATAASATGATTPSVGGDGSAYDIARSLMGRNISDLKYHGPLAKYLDKWPGNNVCCANFVSACLEKAGQISHGQHNDSVRGLATTLSKDPEWQKVSLKDAKPGDVVCMNVPGEGAYGHVVMFAGWKNGKPVFIGSNNANADGTQRITEGQMNYGITAVFHYHG